VKRQVSREKFYQEKGKPRGREGGSLISLCQGGLPLAIRESKSPTEKAITLLWPEKGIQKKKGATPFKGHYSMAKKRGKRTNSPGSKREKGGKDNLE